MAEQQEPYRPGDIEPRAQKLWEQLQAFQTEDAPDKKPLYVLDMFPYPSGEGLHVGHVEGYTATDIYARYKRMQGCSVLHPMGWDAFGLPAENAAIKRRTHPAKLVGENVARFKQQLERLGFSYDWSREINTTDPAYYTWTQWIFLKLFHLGLAYEAVVPIHWCPSCKTGLANEEVIDGKCERCGTSVEKKDLRQWLLRITKYADRLLRDLDALDWPEGIKELQRNWIGRSEGTEVVFRTTDGKHEIPVFTTRADTLFGATYLVLAPEHPLVESITVPDRRDEVLQYTVAAKNKSEIERTTLEKEKTGVDTGAKAVNPVSGEEIPIWVADYVLVSYGTGAIMAVPVHDARDFEFAKTHTLPRKCVIDPDPMFAGARAGESDDSLTDAQEKTRQYLERVHNGDDVYTGHGRLMNSGEFDGMPSTEASEKITAWLAKRRLGKSSVQYKLRDWVFSRQRYWGEPIPLVHCPSCGVVPVPEDQLPVLLPDVDHYEPTGTGESPLAGIESWVNTTCPKCGKPAKRETNTMPQWAGSCWYFLRFVNPHLTDAPWKWEEIERWLPVHLYLGGAEHAVLHLLYARFWVKALFDGGYLPVQEPFAKLRNQGMIAGPDGQKMSKSRGNVVSPDEIIEKYGADTLRLYEMFLGPLDAGKPWNPRAVSGVYRFLHRVWAMQFRLADNDGAAVSPGIQKLVKKVTGDIEALKFNTAIAAMMEFINLAEKEGVSKDTFRTFLLVLSPFAPHLAEELWRRLPGEKPSPSVVQMTWPAYDPSAAVETDATVVVQVDGKVRDTIVIPRGLSNEEVRAAAEKSERVQKHLKGKSIVNVIVVPNRLVNFVTRAS